jgi:lipid-binding SYLF domain-containing protein
MRNFNTATLMLPIMALLMITLSGCTTAPNSPERRASLDEECQSAITELKSKHRVNFFFEHCYGYAVFPGVGTGAFGIGAAYGKGQVYEQGKMVGYCDLTQGTVGAQIGGQSYSEIIFFQNKAACEDFKSGQTAFDAAASAVAADAGASADADYKKGVVVFTMAQGGLMVQAAIGGQHFAYVPK